MSTKDSITLDEMLAWRPQEIEYGIAVAITMDLAGETVTGQADFTHDSIEGEDLDYRNMTITWFEANCELHNVSWDKGDEYLNLFTLSEVEALASEFNFDVDYQEV